MSRTVPKSATLAELADLIGGRLIGDPDLMISRVAPIDAATTGDITFVSNPKYVPVLNSTGASAVIVHLDFDYDGNLPRIEATNPYLAFAQVQTHLAVESLPCQGVSESACVASSAIIGPEVTVSAGCFVGENVKIGKGSYLHSGVILYDGVTVGEGCQLHAGTVIREGCQIGNRVILQPNCTIGSDGFGFAPDGEKYFKIPQVGIVVIEDDVEIGSCSCVDRGALGQTLIKQGTKIDNLVHVAHNVEVGENTIMVAQVGIAGSTIIGSHCTFGGQSAAIGHLKIGDNVTVVARGGVSANTEGNQAVAGFPTMPHKQWLKASSGFAKLPEMRKEIQRLKKQVDDLENRMKEK